MHIEKRHPLVKMKSEIYVRNFFASSQSYEMRPRQSSYEMKTALTKAYALLRYYYGSWSSLKVKITLQIVNAFSA